MDQTQWRIEQLQKRADKLLNKQEAIELLVEREKLKKRRNDALITELKDDLKPLLQERIAIYQELAGLRQVWATDRAASVAAAAAATAPDGTGSANSIARRCLFNCITQ